MRKHGLRTAAWLPHTCKLAQQFCSLLWLGGIQALKDTVLSSIISIYSDPARVLALARAERATWCRIWLGILLGSLCMVAILAAASLSGQPPAMILGYAALALVPLMIAASIAITTTGHPLLWLAFLGTPPALFSILLSGLGPLWPVAWILSGAIGVPLLLGILLSNACAVWIYNQILRMEREKARLRQTGMASDLPALALQNRARLIRFGAAIVCVLLAGATLLLFWPTAPGDALVVGLALVAGAAATLRLEAALLCFLGKPLVKQEEQGSWHTTYAGRWAFFAPVRSLLPLLANQQPAGFAGAALIALFSEGSLGPVLRRACRNLSAAQAHNLALGLSLQAGGATVIRYLVPVLPLSIQPIALTYADLATEAARPPDLQRWLAALNEHRGIVQLSETELAPELAQALALCENALGRYTYDPIVDQAIRQLRQIIPTLYDGTPTQSLSGAWPAALLERVIAQWRLLSANSTSDIDTNLVP